MLMLTMPNSSFSVSILKHSPKPTVQQVPNLKLETANMASKQLLSYLQTHHLQTPRIFLSWPCLKQESIHVLSSSFQLLRLRSYHVGVCSCPMSYTVILCLCMSMYCSDLFGMSIDMSSYWDLLGLGRFGLVLGLPWVALVPHQSWEGPQSPKMIFIREF